MSAAATELNDGSSMDDWAPRTPAAAPVVETPAEPADVVVLARPKRDWYSGWCGAGDTCGDGRSKNKIGEPILRCLYVAENGSKATLPRLYCSCACHDGSRAAEDPRGSTNVG